jgi:tRNA wybutosine-synthesizing protein 2
MRKVPQAKVPAEKASEMIPRLFAEGIADPGARITGGDGFRLVPIIDSRIPDAEAMGLEILSGDAYSEASRPPMERIREALSDIPSYDLARLPEKWEKAGDVITLKLGPSLYQYGDRIGKVYAEVLGVRAVLADVSGVSGELRTPEMRLLWGEPGESVKTENGIHYCYDVTKVMFASGNLEERRRMETLDCRGETVVDLFCGIGYFTLPLAKFACARRVFACEKNPDSYRFLVKNIALNDVGKIIIPMLGDNRSIPGSHFADRILMGYVQTTSEFLPKAKQLAKPGCVIHYHDTYPVGEQEERVRAAFSNVFGEDGFEVLGMREVKSFAPSVSHYVADVRVR